MINGLMRRTWSETQETPDLVHPDAPPMVFPFAGGLHANRLAVAHAPPLMVTFLSNLWAIVFFSHWVGSGGEPGGGRWNSTEKKWCVFKKLKFKEHIGTLFWGHSRSPVEALPRF